MDTPAATAPTHAAATALEVDPAEISRAEENRAAARRLHTALRAAGVRAVVDTGDGDAVPITAMVVMDRLPRSRAGTDLLPTPDTVRAFEALLREQGIAATVAITDVGEPALRVALHRAADAEALAERILQRLPEPHAAAHRPRTALTAAGIGVRNLHVDADGRLRIGDISARDALALGELLHGDVWDDDLDPDDWRHLDRTADLLIPVLHTATDGTVAVDPRPGCDRCGAEHGMTLGPVTAEQAHRLADAVHRPTTS